MLAEKAANKQSCELMVGLHGSTPTPIVADKKGAGAPKPIRTPDLLRPGTLLAREHGRVLHRVLVEADGFSWQGQSYDSLSKVALAITGTRWNGPRFFGLRDKPARAKGDKRQCRVNADAVVAEALVRRKRVSKTMRSPSRGAAP